MREEEVASGLDDLFGAPVEEFVARRDALAKGLKAGGDATLAAEVKAWRRPSRVVGALNRLALTEPQVVEEFAEAVEAVADQQPTGGSALREATSHLRSTSKQTASAAVAGLTPSRPSDAGDVGAALLVVASDPDALERFRTGRLLDLPDPGLGGFGFGADITASPSAAAASAKPRPGRRRTSADAPAAAPADELAAKRRKAQRAKLLAASQAAEAALERATSMAEDAEQAVDPAQERRDRARAELESAEDDLATAMAAAEAGRAALAGAREERDAAQAALDEAEEAGEADA